MNARDMILWQSRRPAVLVVEGNEWLVKLYRSIFADLGRVVVHAPRGRDVAAALDGRTPELVIMDTRLSDGPGELAAEQLRRAVGPVTVIGTATQPAGVTSPAFDAVIRKPLDVPAFSALVRKHLTARQVDLSLHEAP